MSTLARFSTYSLWKKLLLGVFFWSVVGLFFSTQTYISIGAQEGAWATALRNALPQWYLWGALTPFILASDRWVVRHDVSPGRRIALHVPLGFAWCTVFLVLLALIYQALDGWPADWSFSTFAPGYHWRLLVYAVIVGSYVAFDYYHQARERELRGSQLEASLAEARLHTLKAQLHPHFLFNTLNAISAFMERDPKTARRMIAHLGDLLRQSLDHGDRQEITLADEMKLAADYMEIQKIRFPGLEFEMDVEDEVLQASVPSLLLQPLLENAVRHGVAERVGEGRIRVVVRGGDGKLRLSVTDNGVGLPSNWSAKGDGVGLANTKERVHHLYGGAGRVTLGNGKDAGTVVDIVIPWHTDGS